MQNTIFSKYNLAPIRIYKRNYVSCINCQFVSAQRCGKTRSNSNLWCTLYMFFMLLNAKKNLTIEIATQIVEHNHRKLISVPRKLAFFCM
jgi:hypothetical protein